MTVTRGKRLPEVSPFSDRDRVCDWCEEIVPEDDQLVWLWGASRFRLLMHGKCFDKWASGLLADLYRLHRNMTNREALEEGQNG